MRTRHGVFLRVRKLVTVIQILVQKDLKAVASPDRGITFEAVWKAKLSINFSCCTCSPRLSLRSKRKTIAVSAWSLISVMLVHRLSQLGAKRTRSNAPRSTPEI